jgi:hypothetical protein
MTEYSMLSDELLGLATPRGGGHGDDNGVPSGQGAPVASNNNNDNDDDAMDDGSLQVRTMDVPRWLSTTDVTGESQINCKEMFVALLHFPEIAYTRCVRRFFLSTSHNPPPTHTTPIAHTTTRTLCPNKPLSIFMIYPQL